jgi:hypothetical protein
VSCQLDNLKIQTFLKISLFHSTLTKHISPHTFWPSTSVGGRYFVSGYITPADATQTSEIAINSTFPYIHTFHNFLTLLWMFLEYNKWATINGPKHIVQHSLLTRCIVLRPEAVNQTFEINNSHVQLRFLYNILPFSRHYTWNNDISDYKIYFISIYGTQIKLLHCFSLRGVLYRDLTESPWHNKGALKFRSLIE